MSLSNILESRILDALHTSTYDLGRSYTDPKLQTPCQIVINLKSETIEIPAFITFGSSISGLNVTNLDDIVMDLNYYKERRTYKTAESLLRNLLGYWPHAGDKLTRLWAGDRYYYGALGILLDSDFSPLLLCTREGTITNNRLRPKRLGTYRVHISPKVFLETTKINTYIVKNIIPYLLTLDTDYLNTSYYIGSIQVILDNSPGVLRNIAAAPPSSTRNINDFLEKNSYKVIEQFKFV